MLVSLAGVGAAGKDYYSLLGVSKTATDQQLKKAYRKAAMRWHPDKHPENKEKATARFQEIAEAYETLSDPEKRRLYDLGGAEAAKGQPGPGPADSGDRGHAHPGHGVRFTSQGGDVDPEVLRRFAEMFSGQTGAGFQGPGVRHFFSSGGGPGFGFGGGHPGFDGRAQPQAAKQGPPLFGAGAVQELSFDNHRPQIEKLRSKGAAVVLFYSSGGRSCPRLCHEIRAAFARFAEARKGELPVVALQCLRRKGECAKHADGFPAVVLIGRDQKQDAVLSKGVAASFSQLQAAFGKAWPNVSQAHLSPEKGTVSELKTVHIANKDQLCGGQYCLLLVERGPEERARGARAALQKAARRLRSQPVHAFYVRAEKHPGFVASFAKASSGLRGRLAAQVLLVRPKSDRYEVFDGDAGDPAALVDFVSTVLSRGTALPHRRLAV